MNHILNVVSIFCGCMTIDAGIKVSGCQEVGKISSERSTKEMTVVDKVRAKKLITLFNKNRLAIVRVPAKHV